MKAALRARCVGPVLLFAVCTLLMVGPHVFPPSQVSRLAYEPQDSAIFLWNFWWTQLALTAQANPYWTDRLFHPEGTSLAFHSYPLSYSLLALPIQRAVPGPEGRVLALNALILLSFFASGLGAYRLAAYATGSRRAGLVAGLSYAFVPYHFLNMVNLHLLAIEVLPFYVLALLRLAARPGLARAAAVAGWLGLAFYTSLEYALYLALYSALWLLAGLARRSKKLTPRFVAFALLSAAGFVVLAAPLLLRQVRETGTTAVATIERDMDEVRVWSPALAALFVPSRQHPVYGEALAFLGEYGEARSGTWGMRSEASLSLVSLLLVAVAFGDRGRSGRVPWALGAATFAVLSLGPFLRVTGTWVTEIPLPYLLLYDSLPFFRAGRDPTRLLPLAMLLLSITAAFGTRALLRRAGVRRNRVALTAGLGALVLFESLVGVRGSVTPRIAHVYHVLAAKPGDFAILDLSSEYERLLGQTVHGKKLTAVPRMIPRASAGAMARVEADLWQPLAVLGLPPAARAERVAADRRELRELGIRYAVLPNEPLTRARVDLATGLGARLSVVEDRVLCAFD